MLRMREQLLFDGADASRKLSRFWTLLVLAAVIASAGVVADSTATVIGAMIVAPLMTPILGLVLSIVAADGRNALRSLALILAGAALVVIVGYLVAMLVPYDVVASNSSQVAGRIHPRLVDLAAALATGAVGSFALVRSDVSDTISTGINCPISQATAITATEPVATRARERTRFRRSPITTESTVPRIGVISGATIIAPITVAVESEMIPAVAMIAESTSSTQKRLSFRPASGPENSSSARIRARSVSVILGMNLSALGTA